MSPPFFSVIIPCRNAGRTLAAALDSVLEQTERDWELIVVDGDSTDGSAEILAARRTGIAALIQEPDTGVYPAMNKGRRLAHGRWLLFLGADDRLDTPTVLARTRAEIGDTAGSVCCGEARYDDGRVWRPGDRHIRRNFVHHQACFYDRTLLAATAFDEGLRFQADYDLNLRLWRAGVPFIPLALRVSRCGTGGLSDSGRWANYREEITVRHRHFPAWRCWPWDAGSVVRYGRKKIVRSRASTRPE